MTLKTLFLAGIKKQKGSLIGIFLLILGAAVSLTIAVTVYHNSGTYIAAEMDRVGYGTFTAWVSGALNLENLQEEVQAQEGITSTTVQPIIFAGYSLNGGHSDDEGELIAYEPRQYNYRFFTNDLAEHTTESEITPGQIYLSPVMADSFQASIGDEIHFELGREGTERIFTVAGYFEDPFMGSAMIDMKSFLISPEDYAETLQLIETIPEHNQISRAGAMLHIFADESKGLSVTEWNQQLNSETSLGTYSEMMYSKETIYGFMLVLQNIVIGFLAGFTMLLLFVILIVSANSIRNAIVQEFKDIGILKTIGCTTTILWKVKIFEYMAPVAVGMILGIVITLPLLGRINRLTIISTGVLIPSELPAGLIAAVFLLIMLLFFLFLAVQTRQVIKIRPIQAILGQENESPKRIAKNKIHGRSLSLSLAFRQLLTGWKMYAGVFAIMALLTILLSVVERLNAWVGPEGEGLMNSFSVARHDLGIQPMTSDFDMGAVEEIIGTYSEITDTYKLAMENGTVNGVDLTINVLDQPEWFHVLSGNTVTTADEILITQSVAQDLGVSVGDELVVSSGGQSAAYRITGTYECANEMGGNVGMSMDGYGRISDINEDFWCTHYILADGSQRETIMDDLMKKYRTEADIHTNSWSGLDGIVSTLHLFIYFMYGVAAFIISVVIVLSGSKVLSFEERSLAIYKSIGFTSNKLRISFGLRYGIVAAAGAVTGILLSNLAADRVVSILLRNFGIGEFHSAASIYQMTVQAGIIILLVFVFAVLSSEKIKIVSVTTLLQGE